MIDLFAEFCGPKSKNLIVKNSEKYNWEPKKILDKLTDIYLHLDCDTFAQAVVNDERCYSKHLFLEVINCMRKTNIIAESKIQQFNELSENYEKIKESKVLLLDLNDETPEEFKCPILGTLMVDPVKLPSGHVLDRSTIGNFWNLIFERRI